MSYQAACNTPSDINQHLPLLKEFASHCSHITEFGVRTVVSTWALMAAHPKTYRGYDLTAHHNMKAAEAYAHANNIDCAFVIESTLKANIEPTDFLFIDTLHRYEQLSAELKRHAHAVNKYIGFHDVSTFGYWDERPGQRLQPQRAMPGTKEGLLPAIFEFMQANPQWKVAHFNYVNNGLLILEKL
ncbi:MAG TPA: hypothetical protein VG603_15215 [Chitinophagales bacterium]|nr:hypothetical protein [Chitinophagales bacterium]